MKPADPRGPASFSATIAHSLSRLTRVASRRGIGLVEGPGHLSRGPPWAFFTAAWPNELKSIKARERSGPPRDSNSARAKTGRKSPAAVVSFDDLAPAGKKRGKKPDSFGFFRGFCV